MAFARRAERTRNRNDLQRYRRGSLLPKGLLDGRLEEKVRPPFIRGSYDTAVFEAYKELEIRVREAAQLPSSALGKDLMRKAFHPDTGPLSNQNLDLAEREAMAHLFAGSIGLFKNPSSHRNVDLSPEEALDLIFFADYLLRLIPQPSTPAPQPGP